jgi:hypothetical protein
MSASTRGKIAVLVSGVWLYGRANRLEFARAVGSDERYPTFQLTKHRWEGGLEVVPVVGRHVGSWKWATPEVHAKPKRRAAKSRAMPAAARHATDVIRGANEHSGHAPLTAGQATDLVMETADLPANTVAMLCIAAGVYSMDQLTQATLPAFREALAANRAGAGVPA